MPSPLRLKLPATSANLGPGFDTLGLAMDFALHVEAREADGYSIHAAGRNVAQCGDVQDSLVLDTYKSVLTGQGIDPPTLHLDLVNEIPLGMGCGSSAAALVAGVALASHFGGLRWDAHRILTEASLREGHPDNVAACVLGGLTVSSMSPSMTGTSVVHAVSINPPVRWPLLLVMPDMSLSTKKARGLLPASYSSADVVTSVQNVAMLTAAFSLGRGDLLGHAMQDLIHQPYRAALCTLLPALEPLTGTHGILGLALSGAGPSVLLVLEEGLDVPALQTVVENHLLSVGQTNAEYLQTHFGTGAIVTA